MVTIQYRPITRWPGRLRAAHERTRAPFKAGHSDTLEVLGRELRMISAESCVVQLALLEGQFTRDGRPYYQARPEHPGVIVSFRKPVRTPAGERTTVPLNFPCDRFDQWEANLRAVAIALEDLRRIDRYGVVSNSQQYIGFRALPPPGPDHNDVATVDEAARMLAEAAEREDGQYLITPAQIIGAVGVFKAAYIRAAKNLHPDPGVNLPEAERSRRAADWSKLQAAKALLDDHHRARAD